MEVYPAIDLNFVFSEVQRKAGGYFSLLRRYTIVDISAYLEGIELIARFISVVQMLGD